MARATAWKTWKTTRATKSLASRTAEALDSAPPRTLMGSRPAQTIGHTSMTDLSARKSQLETRLAELSGRLDRIEDHLEQPPNQDWEDRAQEAEMDEVLEELGEVGMTEVTAIRAALDRIANGTYGRCVRCDGAISKERLDVLPHTPLCKTCAAEVAAARRN